MTISLLGLVVAVLLFCLAYWAIHKLAAIFEVSGKIVGVFDVLLVVVCVLWLLQAFGLPVTPFFRIR